MSGFLVRGSAAALAICLITATMASGGEIAAPATSDGVITVRSLYSVTETVDRLLRAVGEKGIMHFATIDQSKLGAGAGVTVRQSMLLEFGNPALGVQFVGGNPLAGLDWPVRLLVLQDANGQVWTAYSDFAWIARRHHIANRNEVFVKATEVITSINDSIRAK